MADALIEVVDYDPAWPAKFAEEKAVILKTLGAWLAGSPEHVGSTAVPGLAAKPVIDIMAPVESLEAARDAILAARAADYVHYPYRPESMHWFCKPAPEFRTHHLYLVPSGSRVWRERIAFRDALRRDPALRLEYQRLKLGLAAQYRNDREAYTEAKHPFISKVLASLSPV